MQPGDHFFAFSKAVRPIRGIARVRRKKSNTVIAPIVGQPSVQQMTVIDEGVDRQEFNGCHAQGLKIRQDLFGREPLICALESRRHRRMAFRESAHVHFINDRVVPRHCPSISRSRPVKVLIDHSAFRHKWSTITLIKGPVITGFHVITEQSRIPLELPHMRIGVRIEKQFMWIKAMAGFGIIGTMDAIPIGRTWMDAGQIPVPDLIGIFRQGHALDFFLPRRVEDAHLHLRGVGRKDLKSVPLPSQVAPRGMGRPSNASVIVTYSFWYSPKISSKITT